MKTKKTYGSMDRPGRELIDEQEEIECETCRGKGTIDETLGGEPFSNPEAECPDCDGHGSVTIAARHSRAPQPVAGDVAIEAHAGELSDFGKRMAAEDPLYLARSATLKALDKYVNAWLDNYEFDDGENFTHSPNELESLLIADAFEGLMADAEYRRLSAEWQALCTSAAPERIDGTSNVSAPALRPPAADMETVMREWADDSMPNTVTGMVELLAPGGNAAMPVQWAGQLGGPKLVKQSDALTALAAKQAEIDRLKARLEHDPAHGWDGIACRDETIKMLEGSVSSLTAERDEAVATGVRKPLPPQSPVPLTAAEFKVFKLGWLECEAAHGTTAAQ